MTTYISILRGINVGGKKPVKMVALKTLYEHLNFKNVRTYIQSGNVIFDDEETGLRRLEDKIKTEIERTFGFDVPVIILTKDTLQQIIDQNPFARDPNKETSYLHVTFFSDKPKDFDESLFESKKQEGEEMHFAPNAVYLYLPKGYSKTKLNNKFFESKLKVNATTRNWKTAKEILNVAYK